MDEFFIYTRSLDVLSNEELGVYDLPSGWTNECNFYAVDDSYWKQDINGRMMMFMPVNPDKSGDDTGHYTILMKTNRAKSDDMIRVASNDHSYLSALPGAGDAMYDGNTYRSFIFELATYRPFRFAAQVAINGGEPVGTWNTEADMLTQPDPVDHLVWTYIPNQKVDINLDITSFVGSDGRSADPFGTAFEVYIDAPMLKIDESRLTPEMAAKLKPHATIPGRFVYTVDASREEERKTGNGGAVMVVDNVTASQAGERKTLPFVTAAITNAGEIVISSDNAVCEFFEKRFKVSNAYIEGDIKYVAGGVERDVARGEFVSFAVERTGVRIGSMNITVDGHFALNLRAEYSFTWDDDELLLSYIKDGVVYEAYFASLKALYDSVVTRGEAIVLRE
jgi:hypothetical protein